MTRRPNARAAFTLIELLVVIAIIGILVSLTLPAVQKVRSMGNRTRAVSDISSLTEACQQFKVKYGFYPPSTFTFPTSAIDPNTAVFTDMFKRWPPAAVSPPTGFPTTITGSQCLVYFLGGPNGTGWSGDAPVAPSASAAVKNVFMDFPSSRVVNGAFIDPWGTPYNYLASGPGGNYGANANYPATVNGVTFYQSGGKPVNQGTVQVISAGENKAFGSGNAWVPGSGQYASGQPGFDDLANFNGVMLGVKGN